MADYTITLTDTEVKSMKSICGDVDDWITNAAKNRARIAKDDIISNSWGISNFPNSKYAPGMDVLSLILSVLSTPNSLHVANAQISNSFFESP